MSQLQIKAMICHRQLAVHFKAVQVLRAILNRLNRAFPLLRFPSLRALSQY